MKLTIIESTTGRRRQFDQGNQDMSIAYLIQKVSHLYKYDKRRMKLLYMTQVLNKTPDLSISTYGIKPGDTLYVLNFQRADQNSFVTHLNHL